VTPVIHMVSTLQISVRDGNTTKYSLLG